VWLRPPITAIPSRLFNALQYVRGRFLRLATPLDAAFQRARGIETFPPLWLRRHVGAVRNLESATRQMADIIGRLELVRPDDHVLDIGCGTGAMASVFAQVLGAQGRYVGFDVNPEAIGWCREAFSADSRFAFELADIASPCGAAVSRSVSYRFPMADQEAGLVLAKSVFTHLLEADVRRYLGEIRRVLQPGRTAVITAFLFGKDSLTGRGRSPIFRFGDPRGFARWRWKARPESAIAYERDYFSSMIADAGLRLGWFSQGFWPGDAARFTGQDILFVGR
jgi:SAM-dependent methyltransferase